MLSNFIARFALCACGMLILQPGRAIADQNISTIEQIGSGNSVVVTQHGGGLGGAENNVQIEQNGEDQTAEIHQTGIYLENDASVLQTGLGNMASIIQGGHGGINTAMITQDGEANNARIAQQAMLLGLNPNTATIIQSGIGNNAEIDQTGSSHEAEIKQNGDYNGGGIVQHDRGQKAYLEQNGNNLAHPTIIQYGPGAEVTVVQTQ